MSFLQHSIIWQVYPLSADLRQLKAAADNQPTGSSQPERSGENSSQALTLARLEHWLDYLVNLGCDTLLLGPIFDSVSHGYDTTDHYRIDPRLGTDHDIDSLISQCHRRGVRLILDGVFNHVAASHPMVNYDGPIKRDDSGNPVGWEGHDELVELNHQDPRTEDFVAEIMEYWLQRGIDGWRLDVAYAVPREFWAAVVDRVRQQYPHAVFLGEMIHGDYIELIHQGHLDSATQYELWKAIWSSIKDRNFWELAHALERHHDFSQQAILNIFVGNHDVDRIASIVGDGGAALAASILFSLPGCPSIYYGDEQAFRGLKGEGFGADDPIRPALPDYPEHLAQEGQWLWQVYHDLIALRRRHSWLSTASVEVKDKDNESISYRLSAPEGFLDVHIDIRDKFRADWEFNDGEELHYSW
ncbi:alpha-amylase [Corynebacterium poyangense]|uniref:Alpha-amylase n=1 Tax=Corynebacterium poyangense TaxID=2684405 RepID=A0A7H0SN21_9CORY|nr:alpha-amylase family glycosyl hydrolase [Corynebacterium poyangense]MBZ8176960.1 alpha-amylase [Corynebacterium poyangense]QNQ89946.1 alpha-amylase [Corynebacterium poyangense]